MDKLMSRESQHEGNQSKLVAVAGNEISVLKFKTVTFWDLSGDDGSVRCNSRFAANRRFNAEIWRCPLKKKNSATLQPRKLMKVGFVSPISTKPRFSKVSGSINKVAINRRRVRKNFAETVYRVRFEIKGESHSGSINRRSSLRLLSYPSGKKRLIIYHNDAKLKENAFTFRVNLSLTRKKICMFSRLFLRKNQRVADVVIDLVGDGQTRQRTFHRAFQIDNYTDSLLFSRSLVCGSAEALTECGAKHPRRNRQYRADQT